MYIGVILITIVALGYLAVDWTMKINLIPKFMVFLGIAALWVMVGFSCLYRVEPGEVGVVVDLIGSHKGVEDKELNVGLHLLLPWKTVYLFPIYEQNHQWVGNDGFSFQTSEGLPVHADIGITFNLNPTRIHELFARYRRGMDEITHLFIRNNIRDAINRLASKMKIEDLYGPKKEDFFIDVQKQVQTEIAALGFNITHLYIIGSFSVPDNVKVALNKKIEATQKAQQRENELREAEAQARKEIAIAEGEAKSRLLRAESEAKANKLVAGAITVDLLRLEAIKKWDGILPQVMADPNILMQMPTKGKEKANEIPGRTEIP